MASVLQYIMLVVTLYHHTIIIVCVNDYDQLLIVWGWVGVVGCYNDDVSSLVFAFISEGRTTRPGISCLRMRQSFVRF